MSANNTSGIARLFGRWIPTITPCLWTLKNKFLIWHWRAGGTLKTETYNWKGNGVGFLWLIKIAKCYNISFALYSNDDTGKYSEICLWFYFGMNCYFSLDGLFATQAQDHDGTRELHESLSNRIVLCGLSPACLWL